MLVITIADLEKVTVSDHKITWFKRKSMPVIFNSCILIFNDKKFSLCRYMELKIAEEGMEIRIFNSLPPRLKNFAFLLLGTFLVEYHLKVTGINITVSVNPAAEKYFGKRYTEKVMFANPVLFHALSPDKETAKVDIPAKQCRNLLFAQNRENIDSTADYFPITIPVENIHSLIVT